MAAANVGMEHQQDPTDLRGGRAADQEWASDRHLQDANWLDLLALAVPLCPNKEGVQLGASAKRQYQDWVRPRWLMQQLGPTPGSQLQPPLDPWPPRLVLSPPLCSLDHACFPVMNRLPTTYTIIVCWQVLRYIKWTNLDDNMGRVSSTARARGECLEIPDGMMLKPSDIEKSSRRAAKLPN